MTIKGANLDQALEASFLLRNAADNQLRASIRRSSPDAVGLDLKISANAEFGERRFAVTTAIGTGNGPPEATFRVVPGTLQIGIILLTLAAAIVHPLLRFPASLFVVDSVGYLLLLAGMYLPLPGMASARPWLRWMLLVFAIANVMGWIIQISEPPLIRFVAPLVEVGLAILVFVENQQPQWKDRLQTKDRIQTTE